MGAGAFFAGLAKGFGTGTLDAQERQHRDDIEKRRMRVQVLGQALENITDPSLQAEAMGLMEEIASGKTKLKGTGLAGILGLGGKDTGDSKVQEFLQRPRQTQVGQTEGANIQAPVTHTTVLPPIPGVDPVRQTTATEQFTLAPVPIMGTVRGPLATPAERATAALAGKTAELQAMEPFKIAEDERRAKAERELQQLRIDATNAATKQTWLPLPVDVTKTLGLPGDFKVPPGDVDSYIRIYEKSKQEPTLKFESHVDETTGDVTTVGRDPVTGKLKFQDTVKGIAKKRPPQTTYFTNTEEGKQLIEEVAQSLANGDLSRLRDIASLRGDQRLRIYARAKQINPKFSTAELDRKIKMEDSFTNGKDGQNLQSFGIFLEHAGDASDAVNSIRQTRSTAINRPINWWRQNMAGDANFQSFATSLEPVRKEFEGFLLGGHALYADDRKRAEIILNENSSPAQIQAALTRLGHTAKARYNEMNYRYRRVMGKDIAEPFSQEAIAGAARIGVNLMGSKDQVPGTFTVNYNGKAYTFPSQAAADGFKKEVGIK